MENRVGTVIPTKEQVSDFTTKLHDVLAFLKTFGVTLSDTERTSRSHPRKESSTHVETVLKLATQYGLSLPNAPVQGVRDDFELVSRIEPMLSELPLLQQTLKDTIAQAEHEYWEGFLAYYGALVSMSSRIPELAAALKEVIDFMSTGKRR
jgi:hypothetical protein